MRTQTSSYQVQYTSVQHKKPRCCRTHNDNTATGLNTAHSSAAKHRCGRRRSLEHKTHTSLPHLLTPAVPLLPHLNKLHSLCCTFKSRGESSPRSTAVQKASPRSTALQKALSIQKPQVQQNTRPAETPKPQNQHNPCQNLPGTHRHGLPCLTASRPSRQQLHPSGRWLLHLLLPGGDVHNSGTALVTAAVAVVEQAQLPHGLSHHHICLLLCHNLLHSTLHFRV